MLRDKEPLDVSVIVWRTARSVRMSISGYWSPVSRTGFRIPATITAISGHTNQKIPFNTFSWDLLNTSQTTTITTA